jgi:hypothetical protein
VAIGLAAVFLVGAADFVFRLPWGVRLGHLVLLAIGGFELARRVVMPAVRFRPSLADVALRLERAEAGVGARGRLASGVELAGARTEGVGRVLADRAAAEADEAARALAGGRFIRRNELGRAAALLALAAVIAGGTALARPDLARIGLARTFWPFADVDWPKRTAVVDGTEAEVHPIGESLTLRALLTRTQQAMGKTGVVARYRVVSGEHEGEVERAMLTSQERLADVGDARGELFERLIDPVLEGADEGEIEYWFETEDDRTEPRRIRLAARPKVASVTASVTPPAYAAGLAGSFISDESLEVTPDGQGVAAIGPVLAGSRVQVALRLNKPASRAGGGEGWTQPDAQTIHFETLASARSRAEVALTDGLGLQSADPLAIVLEVVEDAPAGVTVVEPAYDESVLATAVVAVAAEGRDDLGMEWLAIEQQLARPPGGSEGAPHETVAAPAAVARTASPDGAVPQELRVSTELDLAVVGARAGDEVWLTATGRDAYLAAPEGSIDERTVRSAVRRLRIIDELTFVEQVRGELAGVRKAAIEIDREQETLRELEGEAFDPAAAADRQSSVTARLDAQQTTLERLEQRIDRNSFDDEALRGLVSDAAGLLGEATRSSAEATQELEELAPEEEAPSPAADAAQVRVREDLESLISMLDQGRDSWVARRSIESLLAEQRSLERETAALGDRTMGQSLEQLTAEELTELERIAARQRDAAERARQTLDGLTDRAELLRKLDPGQAEAMSQAAQRGRQERLSEEMQQAAAQVGQNQTRAAAQGQQAAAEALEEMLEDMDAAESARDEALRRVLASVIESLERLIAAQETQIESLGTARAEADLPGLAEGMVTLATNTLGLLDEIGPQRELAAVVRLVGQAADAQQRAVVSLRASSAESAGEAEDESLAWLREARAEAERLEEQASERETARQRTELRQAYRALLEQQATVSEETAGHVGVELDRRARAGVRAIGQRQQAISEALAELRRSTEALADAAVFELAHSRMDSASAAAAETLLAGSADGVVQRRQATIARLLKALIDALAEQQQKGDDQFRDGQAGGGGGGAGGGDAPIIPELAELKLLRAMQAEAMEWTRNVDEADTGATDAEMRELSDLQRELAARGEQLVEKLTQQPQAPGPESEPAEGQVPE